MSESLNGSTIPSAEDYKTTDIEVIRGLNTTNDTRIITSLYTGTHIAADAAISVKEGHITITKGSALALTLADPTATTDDYKTMTICSLTAQAHVITAGTSGFNAKGSSGTLTFGGAIGDSAVLMAYQADWYVVGNVNVTAA